MHRARKASGLAHGLSGPLFVTVDVACLASSPARKPQDPKREADEPCIWRSGLRGTKANALARKPPRRA